MSILELGKLRQDSECEASWDYVARACFRKNRKDKQEKRREGKREKGRKKGEGGRKRKQKSRRDD